MNSLLGFPWSWHREGLTEASVNFNPWGKREREREAFHWLTAVSVNRSCCLQK